jgi:hypothetical protein
MPTFHEVDTEARRRLAKKTRGYQEREIYRGALATLADGRTLEVRPDEGESLRKIKVNLRRSSHELGIDVTYGETEEGTVLVWKEEPQRIRRPRRRRDGQEAMEPTE